MASIDGSTGRPRYAGIVYPDRAEDLARIKGYRVFLDHWDGLSQQIKEFYEDIANRKTTRAVAVYGPQGTGKTLFADQLYESFNSSKSNAQGSIKFDTDNLWHRISGGRDKSIDLVRSATHNSDIYKIEDKENWLAELTTWHAGRTDRICIVIADNAERSYFRQGISGFDHGSYFQNYTSAGFMTVVAQRFVDICRRKIPNTLFLVLSNDDLFLRSFHSEVQKQHRGMTEHRELPLPSTADKERVVRVNTNRLNPISYWFCLDKAGTQGKKDILTALSAANNFPDSFAAVDKAVKNPAPSRIGRPGRRNLLSLIVLFDGATPPAFANELGKVESVELEAGWAASYKYGSGWASQLLDQQLPENVRKSRFLESEWHLRIVFLGHPFVGSLLTNEIVHSTQCKRMLDMFREVYGPGTHTQTRESVKAMLEAEVASWATPTLDLADFWSKGQARSIDYEPKLRYILGDYNKGSEGFLGYRPDCIIKPYRPCSILTASDDDESSINEAIIRDCHVLEFCAFKHLTKQSVQNYLSNKIANYIEITQEQ